MAGEGPPTAERAAARVTREAAEEAFLSLQRRAKALIGFSIFFGVLATVTILLASPFVVRFYVAAWKGLALDSAGVTFVLGFAGFASFFLNLSIRAFVRAEAESKKFREASRTLRDALEAEHTLTLADTLEKEANLELKFLDGEVKRLNAESISYGLDWEQLERNRQRIYDNLDTVKAKIQAEKKKLEEARDLRTRALDVIRQNREKTEKQ